MFKKILAALTILLIINIAGLKAQQVNVNCLNEYQLKYPDLLNPRYSYSYSQKDLADGQANYYKYFHFKDVGDTLKNDDMPVNVSDIIQMLGEVQKLHYDPASEDLAALMMDFGMDGDKIFVIFRPVVLHFMRRRHRQNEFYWELGTHYSIVKDGKFIDYSAADYDNAIKEYRSNNIFITRNDPSLPSGFNDDDKDQSRGDTKFCLLPFQQVLKMYDDNGGDCRNPGKDQVTFHISAATYVGMNNSYKLHVVATFKEPTFGVRSDSFQNLGADFSQMSPPNNIYLRLPLFQ